MRLRLFSTLFLLMTALLASEALSQPPQISFEEAISQPDAVRSQYCNTESFNKGVEFLTTMRVFQPTVSTSSLTHALTNQFPGDEFGEFRKVEIRFTAPQSEVSLNVGLDQHYSFGVTAVISAYSSNTPGTGFVTYNTAHLGNGPSPVNRPISVSSAAKDIRSVVIEFTGPSPGNAAYETIDDLAFSAIGPACGIDTDPPLVTIYSPAADGFATHDPQLELAFEAKDLGSGIATIQVMFLNESAKLLESFHVCGATGAPPCLYDVEPTVARYNFYTYMPQGTRTVRVKAWDFAGHDAAANRTIDFLVPPPTLNLWVMGMEVTQATQPWVVLSNSSRSVSTVDIPYSTSGIPLVKDKRTIVRVYPGIEGSDSVPLLRVRAVLDCTDVNLNPCPFPSEISPVNEINVDPADNNNLDRLRANVDKTWNFVLPNGWTTWDRKIRLRATVSPPKNISECSDCKDGANSLVMNNISFMDTGNLDLTVQWACVRRNVNDPATKCDHSPLDIYKDVFQASHALFGQVLPIAESKIRIKLQIPQLVPFDGNFQLPNADMTSDRMYAFHAYICDVAEKDAGRKRDEIPDNKIQFGVVPAPVTLVLGIGAQNCAIAKIEKESLDGDIETSTEEVGHALGRPHASCDHGESGCEPAPSTFPCVHGGICTFGFNTLTMQVINPGNPPAAGHAHDFMSYGGAPHWVSPYTYEALYKNLKKIADGTAQPASPAAASIAAEARMNGLWLSGVISPAGSPRLTADFNPFYEVALPGEVLARERGEFSLELRDAHGVPIFTRSFQPEEIHGDPPDPNNPPQRRFSEILPFDDAVTSIVLKSEDHVLLERTRSANRPDVAVVAPAGAAEWGSEGLHTIEWKATDADNNEPLHYLVQYSADGGTTWSTLALNWPKTSLQVSGAQLAGSDEALVRVHATDGVNSSSATSGRFVVERKPPVVWISYPRQKISVQAGSLVSLQGGATDLEDGALSNGALKWYSHQDGLLGTGPRLDVQSLSVGVHEITLEAEDSNGQKTTAVAVVAVHPSINSQPSADAGTDQTIRVGDVVTLDGMRSNDPDGDRLKFYWKLVAQDRRAARLTERDTPQSRFTAFEPGIYEVELVVHDGKVASFPDRVTLTVVARD